ncbi:MAG: prepilin-type N-terminal cleavage/methylation domain-containing protein [Phycisphaerae bacterium]|nr:prepilin-type N-terminal cleavage/methylation domain-containing protein [Phycisphaerae bacterium]
MRDRCGQAAGFTLLELLVVIAIIAALVSILMPSLEQARVLARRTQCLANLSSLGRTMASYHADNGETFWPCVVYDHPEPGTHTYFWGTATVPVDRAPSGLMQYCDGKVGYLLCPSMRWGQYVPQGGVDEPTTTYGYNAWCLDPAYWGRRDDEGDPLSRKRAHDLNRPSDLFVFADAAMYWSPAGVPIFQNSTSLDPPTLGSWGANDTPTTHFRHDGRAGALCADGHAATFDPAGGRMPVPERNLGFVGETNVPHYGQD